MRINGKGQVNIPKSIREATGLNPGREVAISLEGNSIVITPVGTNSHQNRRPTLKAAAAEVRETFDAEFNKLSADDLMRFIRG